jgi:hypothetical protein
MGTPKSFKLIDMDSIGAEAKTIFLLSPNMARVLPLLKIRILHFKEKRRDPWEISSLLTMFTIVSLLDF